MGFRMSVLKSVLALLNTLLALLGVGLIALSVFELNASTPGTIAHIAIVVQIFIGSFVILTSFLGCFGTCRNSLGLTWTYAICMLILLAFQLYIIIVAYSTNYVQNASEEFDRLWSNHSLNALAIAEMEETYMCCGKNGSRDYTSLNRQIPQNCYQNGEKASNHLFVQGCLEAMQKYASKSGEIGMTIKWILFCIESLALGFAALLAISIRNKQRREQF